jgi:hypothetical protein
MPHIRADDRRGARPSRWAALSPRLRSFVTRASGCVRPLVGRLPLVNHFPGRSFDVQPAGTRTRTLARWAAALRSARGQGTVEYVALILLVALVMAGVVAAMKGFKTDEGKELADVILGKIKEAVRKVEF